MRKYIDKVQLLHQRNCSCKEGDLSQGYGYFASCEAPKQNIVLLFLANHLEKDDELVPMILDQKDRFNVVERQSHTP